MLAFSAHLSTVKRASLALFLAATLVVIGSFGATLARSSAATGTERPGVPARHFSFSSLPAIEIAHRVSLFAPDRMAALELAAEEGLAKRQAAQASVAPAPVPAAAPVPQWRKLVDAAVATIVSPPVPLLPSLRGAAPTTGEPSGATSAHSLAPAQAQTTTLRTAAPAGSSSAGLVTTQSVGGTWGPGDPLAPSNPSAAGDLADLVEEDLSTPDVFACGDALVESATVISQPGAYISSPLTAEDRTTLMDRVESMRQSPCTAALSMDQESTTWGAGSDDVAGLNALGRTAPTGYVRATEVDVARAGGGAYTSPYSDTGRQYRQFLGYYVVVDGDTLTHIAEKVFGDSRLTHFIYRQNQRAIGGPMYDQNDLRPGMRLEIWTP